MPMFVIIVLFFIYHIVCIFLPTEERVNKLREREREQSERRMNVKGTEKKKVLPECVFFPPLLFLVFVFTQRKTVYSPPMRTDSPAHRFQGSCLGGGGYDCVIKKNG
ncbi:Hypothetical predicted protein [Xyrichtys novacula]|uniref:Uncharacterized protein n=1 Tax=Xyrichtys novacula TaxID=13765 RepID=A0AAV1HAF2_XYRNO|nr:Hypothetical predicted protein [Xyrichtys novacula]